MARVRLGWGLALLAASCGGEKFATTGGDGGAASDGAASPADEDCLDGRDDDGDGHPDCEDPSCAPFVRCVPSPTQLGEWEAYAVLGGADITCPSGAPESTELLAGDPTPLACPACVCESRITCAAAVSVGSSGAVNCNPITVHTAAGGTCTQLGNTGGAAYWVLGAAAVTSRACVGLDAGAPPPPARVAERVRACAATKLGVGCPAGQVCAPRAVTAGGGAALCVGRNAAAGTVLACPAGFPRTRTVVAAGADPAAAFRDERACAPCACDPAPKGAACASTLALFKDTGCGGTAAGTLTSSLCTNVSCGTSCGGALATITPDAGTCGTDGGAPTGAVTLAVDGRQYCCEP